MIQKFEIVGECVPKGRPRFNRRGIAYTPKKTRDYETLVYQSVLAKKPKQYRGGVEVELTVYKRPPTSWSKKKQKEAIVGKIIPTPKPDLDNYLKSVLDGCKQLLWRDDSYIVSTKATKQYAEQAKVILRVKEADGKPAYD